MNVISNILYWISTGLLVPVIVLLIFFFIRAIIYNSIIHITHLLTILTAL